MLAKFHRKKFLSEILLKALAGGWMREAGLSRLTLLSRPKGAVRALLGCRADW